MVAFVRMLLEPTSVLAKQDGMVSIVKMVRIYGKHMDVPGMNYTVVEGG